MKELVLKIYSRSQELILNPRAFWRLHADTNENRDDLFKNLLLPLLAAVSVAVFLGEFFRSDYFRIWVAALWVIREVALFAALYFVGVYGTNELLYYIFWLRRKNCSIREACCLFPCTISAGFHFYRFFPVFLFS